MSNYRSVTTHLPRVCASGLFAFLVGLGIVEPSDAHAPREGI